VSGTEAWVPGCVHHRILMTMTTDSALHEWRRYWYLPLIAGFGYATSVLHVYAIGPFFTPLQTEFDWTRAQISAGLTVTALISTAVCIPIGLLVDRWGPRRIALVGVPMMSASFALLATATGSVANWLLLWAVVAVGTFGVQATVWTSAVATRFQASRGLAFAITLSGAAVAATAFPLIATALIGTRGWRAAFVLMGGLWVLLVLPLQWWRFRGARDDVGPLATENPTATVSGAAALLDGLTLSEGLRTGSFYKLLLAGLCFSFTAIGTIVHFVPILTDTGTEPMVAAGIASLVGIFSVIGRLGTGVLLDRFPPHLVSSAAFLMPIPACLLLLGPGEQHLAQASAAAILGLTVGSEVDVIAFLAARQFGLRHFGALYGALSMALGVGIATGPLVAGAIFDSGGSYAPFLMLTIALMGISAVALFRLDRNPPSFVDGSAPISH